MTRLLLRLHNYLMRHRPLAVVLLVVLLAASALLAMQLHYKENIADFLPRTADNAKQSAIYNALGDQGRITVIFRPAQNAGQDEVMDAIDLFAATFTDLPVQARADESHALQAISHVSDNIALYLTTDDYRRIDSLLLTPNFIAERLAASRQTLSMPLPPMASQMIAADPLGLFSPALQRIQALSPSSSYQMVDDYIFDDHGNGFAFITSPYSGSDTRNNGRLADAICEAIDSVQHATGNTVSISAVGAPLIAVANARQIKHDSLLALSISVVLIALILWRTMGRKRNVLWMGFSVAAGCLFALAAIALFKTEISIIVVGIGSVLIGIAVNYPLHYLEHLKDHPDRRATLREMVEPLVTGNITTVAAFACLVFVKAEAMRDLGLFGSLMLIGTIGFTMVFLPLWAKAGKRSVSNIPDEQPAGIPAEKALVSRHASLLFWLMMLATIVLGCFSTRVEFDADLHNINFMTAQQQTDLDLISSSIGDATLTYVVAEGATLEEALQRNDSLGIDGVASIMPSLGRQQEALAMWHAMLAAHPTLEADVRREARKAGFTDAAFAPFYRSLSADYAPAPCSLDSPAGELASSHILVSDTGVSIVNFVHDSDYRPPLVSGTTAFTQADVGSSLVTALNDDFNYILYVCGFVVFFFLWLSLGRIELALLSFLPMAAGWLWILGIMYLTGLKFNIVNIILATFIFGQGDDYTIFITEGLMYEYAYGRKRLRSYRRSVIISASLMFAGMGVLIFARHPAMRSLGAVSVVGMATVLLMACYLPPLIFRWLTTKNGVRRDVPLTLPRLARTLWIVLVFVVFALIIITPLTLLYRLLGRDSEAKRLRFHRMICSLTGLAVRHLPSVKYSLHNPLGETFSRPAVIIANHQSHLDLLCILSLTPKLVVLTNNWVWRNPVYGAIIRYAEFLPADNGFDANLPKLKALMARGYSVMLFPEGTRSVDGRLGRFHQGAFALARECRADILPVYLHGNNHVMPKRDIVLRPGAIDVTVGTRIAAADIPASARLAASELRALFQQQYAAVSASLETEEYFLPLVRHQYLYKGRDVARRRPGMQSLLEALSHPDRQVTAQFDNEDDALMLQHCAATPANLTCKVIHP